MDTCLSLIRSKAYFSFSIMAESATMEPVAMLPTLAGDEEPDLEARYPPI